MINAIHAFCNDTDIESLLKTEESDIVVELQKLATACSTSNVTIMIDNEQVHFKRMDERKAAN